METIVQATAGKLSGSREHGVHVFRGVPYAAPPVGERRFRAPVPAARWDGTRDATAFGPACPQSRAPTSNIFGRAEEPPTDEDCLTLNVWTPAPSSDERRPVMVWIHGGGFTGGTSRTPWYDGAAFARDGVVCVTINYRLGPLGFMHFPAAGDPNCGLLDQIAALEWVQENIAAFGGDKGNVTIFGESAGGMSVGTLMGSPRASGLFHKAIPQSGAGHNAIGLDVAERVAARFCEAIGAGSGELRDLPVDRLLEGLVEMQRRAQGDPAGLLGDDFAGLAMACQPVIDGDVVPSLPVNAVAAGSARGIPTLVGSTLEEWKLFTAMLPPGAELRIPRPLRNRLAQAGRSADELTAAYEGGGRTDLDVLNAIETDRAFRIPAIRMAEAQAQNDTPVHMYLFAWKTPAFDGRLGACHAIEIPFVFDTLGAGGPFTGPNPPQDLADATHRAWVSFATTGDPGHDGLPDWPAYDTLRRATMVLDSRPALADDPAAGERKMWEGLL